MSKRTKRKTVTQSNQKKYLSELEKLMRIMAVPIAMKQLEDLANSDERKTIWVLCSGRLTREQISKKTGIHLNTVNSFVSMAMTYGLLEEEKGKGGHPKRVIDHVPADWKKLAKKKRLQRKKKQEASEQKD